MTIARRLFRKGSAVLLSWSLASGTVSLGASAVSLIACSSSDDVVASVDEPSSGALPTAQAGGAPLPTIVQSVRGLTATPGAPAPAGTPLPPPPHALAVGEALFVSGTPQSPPVAGAERWPLDEPLRQFFLPAPEPHRAVIVVRGPASEPLRELAARHGLGLAAPMVQVLVEDDAGDQFELVLSEDPPLADEPLPADD